MARIVIGCWGSHGDFDPSLGLAIALKARGHDVTVATLSYYAPILAASGIGFHPLRPDISPDDRVLVGRIMDRDRGTEFLLRHLIAPALRAMHDDLEPLARSADLLVSHPLTMVIPMLAERHSIPWASTVLAPMSFFSAHEMPVVPPAPWLKSLERLGAWPGRAVAAVGRAATARWLRPAAELRTELGLPPGANPLFEGQHSPQLVLALYSKVLGAPQPDWPAHVEVTGHVFHDAAHGTALAPEVEAFLAEGPAPVLFTLGSSAVLSPGRFWEESVAAVRALGVRALLLVGPGNAAAMRDALPPGVLAVEQAPHSLLMPRAAAVVQQCGIGTLAQGLRAGAPILAVPFSHDQPDNAHRAASLGVARVLPPARYRARRVAEELRRLLDDASFREAGARVSAVVRSERGVAAACDALEARFGLR